MYNINKNEILKEMAYLNRHSLQESVFERIYEEENYSSSFEEFKKRLFFEEMIEKTILFNKKLLWNNSTSNLFLTTTAEELLEVYKLRSEVYTEINYQKECPDIISGFNFDKYDASSAIIFYKQNKEVTGTCRVIFDSEKGLPSEEKISFDSQRKEFDLIGEISRNIVKYRNKGLNLEFKYLMRGVYYITTLNNIDTTLFGIKQEDLKLFNKLGSVKIIKELDSYGEVKKPFYIISRETNKTSNFFKKLFL